MIKHEIAINACLKLCAVANKSTHDQLYNIYHLYFNQETFFKNYKQPQSNKYCVPWAIPKISFTWNSARKNSELMVMSATFNP